jgi:hypothetical protein
MMLDGFAGTFEAETGETIRFTATAGQRFVIPGEDHRWAAFTAELQGLDLAFLIDDQRERT